MKAILAIVLLAVVFLFCVANAEPLPEALVGGLLGGGGGGGHGGHGGGAGTSGAGDKGIVSKLIGVDANVLASKKGNVEG